VDGQSGRRAGRNSAADEILCRRRLQTSTRKVPRSLCLGHITIRTDCCPLPDVLIGPYLDLRLSSLQPPVKLDALICRRSDVLMTGSAQHRLALTRSRTSSIVARKRRWYSRFQGYSKYG
jgi:hypothetical protein